MAFLRYWQWTQRRCLLCLLCLLCCVALATVRLAWLDSPQTQLPQRAASWHVAPNTNQERPTISDFVGTTQQAAVTRSVVGPATAGFAAAPFMDQEQLQQKVGWGLWDESSSGLKLAPFLGHGFSIAFTLHDKRTGECTGLFKPFQVAGSRECGGRICAGLAPQEAFPPNEHSAWLLSRLLDFTRVPSTTLWGVCASDMQRALRQHNTTQGVIARVQAEVLRYTVPSAHCGNSGAVTGEVIAWMNMSIAQPMGKLLLPPDCTTSIKPSCEQNPRSVVSLREWTDVAVFDFLIANTDRYNGGNLFRVQSAYLADVHADKEKWRLLWLDHGASSLATDFSRLPSFLSSDSLK